MKKVINEVGKCFSCWEGDKMIFASEIVDSFRDVSTKLVVFANGRTFDFREVSHHVASKWYFEPCEAICEYCNAPCDEFGNDFNCKEESIDRDGDIRDQWECDRGEAAREDRRAGV